MKYSYNIVGLDCANCASKLEEYLNKNDKLKNVVVNFSTSRVSFYTEENVTIDELNSLIKQVEPQAKIIKNDIKMDKGEYNVFFLVLSVILGLVAILLNDRKLVSGIFILISYVLLLYRPVINSYRSLVKNKTINENVLISISALGALFIGKVEEGIMVVALYTLGKILEERAINNTRSSVKEVIEIKQDYANIKCDKGIEKIDVSEVAPNDVLVVKKGEKVPVDGVVLDGKVSLDMSMLTGESEVLSLNIGDEILSGGVNIGDVFEIRTTKFYEDSTVARILELSLNASDKKAKTEAMVTRFSKIYTPIVLILAIMVMVILPLFDMSFKESFYRGLTFLVISCPCAIAISVPLSYFTALGVSSKNGILIKGSNYLDSLGHLKTIIFDKTGTLTTGTFKVKSIDLTTKNYTKDEIIKVLAHGEVLSNHPIAKSILFMYKGKIDNNLVTDFKEEVGKGISYKYKNKLVKVGTNSICDNCKINTNIHVNINNEHVCSIMIDDGIKTNAKQVIENLRKQGIKTIMFTGDRKRTSLEVAKKLGIDVKYEMFPEDKFNEYEKYSKEGLTAFVGDGINDTPVLKRADIGISMGQLGSGSAIEASDIVIMNDDLIKITKSIDISKYTSYIIKQNLIFAIGTKIVILVLSMLGIATMWLAVFADTGVTLMTILNTMRIRSNFK